MIFLALLQFLSVAAADHETIDQQSDFQTSNFAVTTLPANQHSLCIKTFPCHKGVLACPACVASSSLACMQNGHGTGKEAVKADASQALTSNLLHVLYCQSLSFLGRSSGTARVGVASKFACMQQHSHTNADEGTEG